MGFWGWLIIGILVFGIIGGMSQAKEDKEKKKVEEEALRRRKEAEDYILNSGDPEAIKMLMLARANPQNYNQIIAGGMNKGNSTIDTALGVMTGVVVGSMVSDAIRTATISSALNDMQTSFKSDAQVSSADTFFDSSDIDFS